MFAKLIKVGQEFLKAILCKRKKNNQKENFIQNPQDEEEEEEEEKNSIVLQRLKVGELQQVREKIRKLYGVSSQMRNVEEKYSYFIREAENFESLSKNYSIRYSAIKNKLKKICSGYRPVRGDGNCFYTAFGFQFLQILLMEYTDEEFNNFLLEIQTINLRFSIQYQNYQICDQNIETLLKQEFLYRLSNIRNLQQQDRLESLIQQFSAYQYVDDTVDGCFYGLAIIFMRNLSDFIIENSEYKNLLYDRENLLIWETECNSNEIVIAELAKYLKIQVHLLFFDQGEFKSVIYNAESEKFKIILLIRPGHYNIGIPI